MMQYLIVLLDDAAASYCHYSVNKPIRPIELDTLRRAIRYAMMENLMIQFVYPEKQIQEDLRVEIETIDHHKLMPVSYSDYNQADVLLYKSIKEWLHDDKEKSESICVVCTDKYSMFAQSEEISKALNTQKRLNFIMTDIDTFTDDDFTQYKSVLEQWSNTINLSFKKGKILQFNLLTDRLFLSKMNNCQAGVSNITLAPNGHFYVCPAFYYEDETNDIGNLSSGVTMNNAQLFKLDYSPLCRHCDAYQCCRCVWLNKRTTLEVNIPSHEQCVVAHLERNASRKLLNSIRISSTFIPEQQIKEIEYLDPFEILGENQTFK